MMHTYNATTPPPPPPQSSKRRWSGRCDQQHDDVVLMMECICGQGFAYARVVDEDRQKGYSNLVKEIATKSNNDGRLNPPVYVLPAFK
jgi:hypothetical protein